MTELLKIYTVMNKYGLHARSAAKIVEVANQFDCSLFLKKDDQEVDGTSILSILTLSGTKGTKIEARIVGEDSLACMEKLDELFKNRFDENR